MTARILVVEDDLALLSILEAAISFGGFSSESVRNGREAVELLKGGGFDAILMDLGLPDMEGGELLKAFRAISDLPIIVVSGRASEQDKIEALDLGADDYVPKPFLPGELLARIRAALRRHAAPSTGTTGAQPSADDERNPVQLGSLTLDPFHRTAAMGESEVEFNEAEYKVLKTLAANHDSTVPRSAILEALYGDDPPPETKIVEVYISHIRKKLRQLTGDEGIITNLRGRGWILRTPR